MVYYIYFIFIVIILSYKMSKSVRNQGRNMCSLETASNQPLSKINKKRPPPPFQKTYFCPKWYYKKLVACGQRADSFNSQHEHDSQSWLSIGRLWESWRFGRLSELAHPNRISGYRLLLKNMYPQTKS